MSNLHNNDDVFGGDDEPESQPEPTNIGSSNVNISGTNIPGHIVDALEKYLREQGLGGAPAKIPFGGLAFNDIHHLTSTLWQHDRDNIANAAMWQVLNEYTGGELAVRYEKLILEEKIIGYGIISHVMNVFFSELEHKVENTSQKETIRFFEMVSTYFDILQYHLTYYTEEYLGFCQINEFQPSAIVIDKKVFDQFTPLLTYNFSFFLLGDTQDGEYEEFLSRFFDMAVEGMAKAIAQTLLAHDEKNSS